MNKAPFSTLRLGTRFSYEGTDDVWCKIDHNTVAAWDDTLVTEPRQLQSICSFGDDLDEEVVIRERHTSPARIVNHQVLRDFADNFYFNYDEMCALVLAAVGSAPD